MREHSLDGSRRKASAREHRAFAVVPGPPAWQASSRWRPCWDRAVTLLRRVLHRPVHSPPPIRSRTRFLPRPRTASRSPLPNRSISRVRASASSARAAVRLPSANQGDDAFPTRISARPQGTLGAGDYTVVWSAHTADDGEVLAGAYPFRTGVVTNPGAARLAGEWPAPGRSFRAGWSSWASIAAGGFAWARLLASGAGGSTPGSPVRIGTMAIGALAALLATAATVSQPPAFPGRWPLPPLAESLWAMPLGWWIQLVALFILALLCLGLLASGRAITRLPAPPPGWDWAPASALVGLSLTDYALSLPLSLAKPWPLRPRWTPRDRSRDRASIVDGALAVGIALPRGRLARARFGYCPLPPRALDGRRAPRDLDLTGLAGHGLASPRRGPPHRSLRSGAGRQGCHRPDHLVLGLLAMVLPRRPNAARAGRSLVAQGVLALVALFLAAVLALMALPGTGAPATWPASSWRMSSRSIAPPLGWRAPPSTC